jgi:NADH-quinone oxidoreductase subunit L
MTVPLIILLVPTIVAGLWGSPLLGNGFGELVSGHEAHVEFSIGISALSTLLAAGGVGLAWLMYGRGDFRTSAEGRPRSVLDTLLQERYYVDRVYDWGAGRLGLGVGALAARFDSSIIDGAVNGVGSVALSLGGGLRRLQSGQVQTYAWVLFTGTVVLFIVVAGLRPA